MTTIRTTTQVYRVYVRATPEAIWDALTNPDQTDRYGYRGRAEYDLSPGGAYRMPAPEEMRAMGAPDVIVVGEVLEADAPRRLVQTWHPVWDTDLAAETPTRLLWAVDPAEGGVTILSMTHELDGAPLAAAQVAGGADGRTGGWSYVLSDLKTLLETGRPLAG
jgi:uncharacterized protein YndB with AHSA1/START domain